MILHALLLAAAALGHFALFVAFVNWSHGIAYIPRLVDRLFELGTLAFGGASVAGLAWLGLHPMGAWPAWAMAYVGLCAAMGAVVVPAITALRLARRPPEGTHGSSRTLDLAAEHGRDRLTGPGKRSWWLRIPGNQALHVRVNSWRVTRPTLPASLDGLSILHLTDLHFATTYDRKYFDLLIDEVAADPVDLVLFTGDLIDEMETLDWIVPVLSRLRGRFGQYAILGNHDFHHDIAAISAELERAGFTILEGRWASVAIHGTRVALGGTSTPWGPALDISAAPLADARILLSHAPDPFRWAVANDFDLMFSGHNHGGQVRLPVVGPVLMPSRCGRRYDSGFFARGRTLLYSNVGAAAQHPLRLNCPPEIAPLRIPYRPLRPPRLPLIPPARRPTRDARLSVEGA